MPARTNLESAQAFADQFNPPLTVVRTERVNDEIKKDAYAVSYWDEQRRMGITAVFYDRQIKAYIETLGPGTNAEMAGLVFAAALRFQQAQE